MATWREPPPFDPASITPREVWRRPLGDGFSGTAIAEGRIITLFANDEPNETLIALDLRNGSEIWRLDLGPSLRESHGDGPRATPAIAGDLVFALSSLGRLVAVRVEDGREVWRQQLIDSPTWGYASSPLLWEGKLFIHGRLSGKQAALALSAESGELLWSSDSEHPGYASPLRIELADQSQIVSFLGDAVVGLDPQDGTRLWSHPWKTAYAVNAADPIFLPPDRLFVSSGYLQGATLLQLSQDGERFEVNSLWSSREMRNHFSTSVVVDGFLYGFDNSILKCLDLETADVLWRQRGFGKGSLIVVVDHLLILSEHGTVHLARASPEAYSETDKFQALARKTWTPPALIGSWLVMRDRKDLVVFDLSAPAPDNAS